MFFPDGDPDKDYYQEIYTNFGMYNDFLYIALFDEDVYSTTFLQQMDAITRELEAWPEVTALATPTNLTRLQITPFGVNRTRQINIDKPLPADEVMANDELIGQFFARDGGSAAMILRHQAFTVKEEADQFHQKLKAYLNNQGFAEVVISGKIQAQDEFVKRLEQELGFNLALALALVALVLWLIFKTFKGVWISLLTLFITVIWSMSLFGLFNRPLDVMMVMIPPILLVVGMSDIVHLCNKFNMLMAQGVPFKTSLKTAVREVGLATFLTSLTTAVGFLSLMISPIVPIRDFGLYTGMGIMIAYVLAFTLIPCLLSLTGRPIGKASGKGNTWHKVLSWLFLVSLKQRRLVILAAMIITLVAVKGIDLIRQNTSIIVGMQKGDELVQPVVFFDEQYDGYKPFELTAILSDPNDLYSPEILEKLEELHRYLKEEHFVSHIQSPLVVIKRINQALRGGGSLQYKLPAADDLPRVKRYLNAPRLRSVKDDLISPDGLTLRINGKEKDIGSHLAMSRNRALKEFMEALATEGLQFRLTGTSYLIDKTDTYIVQSILHGLLLAIGVIALIIFILTQRIWLTLISIIPNALPLLVLAAVMGYGHIDLNISTAIIFSVAFGIAVDDSIHFITGYMLELNTGKAPIYAIKRTYLTTGKSIVLTSIVLMSGFAVFLLSGFSATFYMGMFIGLTLILALLADLVLLPNLLLMAEKTKARQD